MKTTSSDLSLDTIPAITHGLNCPRCNSGNFVKNGKENSTQRYLCKNCQKSFRNHDGTVIYRLQKKHLLPEYIQCMRDQLSLRKTAKRLGIALSTAFFWRHKLLSSIEPRFSISDTQLLSMKLLEQAYSEKGQRKKSKIESTVKSLISIDAKQQLSLLCLPHKRREGFLKKMLFRTLSGNEKIIREKDKELSFVTKMQEGANRTEKYFGPGIIKTLEQVKNRLVDWLAYFRGIATKYLQAYLDWFRVIEWAECSQEIAEIKLLSDRKALIRYLQRLTETNRSIFQKDY